MNVPRDFSAAGMFPLVVVVEVHTEHVEIPGMAAKLRAERAGQHVACFELAVAVRSGFGSELGTTRRRDHVNDRFDRHNSRASVDLPDGVGPGDTRANQLSLEFTTSPLAVRIEPPDV